MVLLYLYYRCIFQNIRLKKIKQQKHILFSYDKLFVACRHWQFFFGGTLRYCLSHLCMIVIMTNSHGERWQRTFWGALYLGRYWLCFTGSGNTQFMTSVAYDRCLWKIHYLLYICRRKYTHASRGQYRDLFLLCSSSQYVLGFAFVALGYWLAG